MGLTYKREDSLEKLFDEFAIDPDQNKKNEMSNKKSATTNDSEKKEEQKK